jgi:hypothetical protein
MKKVAALITTVLFLLSLNTIAFADSQKIPAAPTIGTVSSTNYAETEHTLNFSPDSVTLEIIVSRNSITEQSSAYLKLYAYTSTNLTSDKITHSFELQQWNGSAWVVYSTGSTYDTDTSIYQNSIYRSVAHQKYYRLKTTHYAYLGVQSIYDILYTSSIYVS